MLPSKSGRGFSGLYASSVYSAAISVAAQAVRGCSESLSTPHSKLRTAFDTIANIYAPRARV